jgi:hypothetical protein
VAVVAVQYTCVGCFCPLASNLEAIPESGIRKCPRHLHK